MRYRQEKCVSVERCRSQFKDDDELGDERPDSRIFGQVRSSNSLHEKAASVGGL